MHFLDGATHLNLFFAKSSTVLCSFLLFKTENRSVLKYGVNTGLSFSLNKDNLSCRSILEVMVM